MNAQSWNLLAIGLAAGLLAFAIAVALEDARPNASVGRSTAADAAPAVAPVALDDASAWAARPDDRDRPALRIRHLGSDLGYVRLGASTNFCAEVVDAHGAPVEGASVTMVTDGAADVEPPTALTDALGSACARLTPHVAGTLRVEVTTSSGASDRATAAKTVEVVSNEAAVSNESFGHARAAAIAGTAGLALLAAVAVTRWARRPFWLRGTR